MKNIERLVRCMTKYGSKHVLIHSIYGTKNWIVCEKFAPDQWFLTLMDPMGNVTYNLGVVNDKDHIELWKELIKTEMEQRASKIITARELKKKIYNFKKKYEQNYKKFIKIEKRTKQRKSPCKAGKYHERGRNGWAYKFRKHGTAGG